MCFLERQLIYLPCPPPPIHSKFTYQIYFHAWTESGGDELGTGTGQFYEDR